MARLSGIGGSVVDATSIAQFVRLESCERYLWYRLHPKETRELLRTWRVTEQPLAILLRTRGARHEHEVVQALEAEGLEIVDLNESGPEVVVDELRAPRSKALVQPKLRAELEGFEAAGVADVVLVRPGGAGLELEVRDAKASRKDRPEHRIQIAFYGMLLQRMAEEAGVRISGLTGSVWRIPAGPGDEQPRPFPLEPYEEAVRLLLDERGVVPRIARASRQEARFHLTYKCDGCTYNALCMREAAETRSLALVPFLSLRDRSALEREGVRDIGALARLKELPPDGRGALRPARDRRSRQVLARLEAEWPLCANLDLHIQRARQVARARGDDVEALRYIIGSGFGSLPDPEEHPGLVQIFVEGQHDYLQDALYLAAALIVGPGGETAEVIELADGPPDLEAEGELVVRWVTRLLDAVRKVAGEEALLHVYVYDRYDQKVLLDALRRHLDRLSALPDFFDLLTETAALSQSMFSFLADEVRDRKNLGILSHSLPMAARRLGFDWHVDGVEYHRRFQARIFDNRRRLDGRWYESAARFNSQIPLEYAYAAWGLLPEPESGEDRPLVEPFRVSREELLGFARARLHALQHVERSFPRKNRALRKEAVRVPGPRRAPRRVRLADVLVEFLYIEHHTKLQALLLHYAQPVERRVASGESILVEVLEDATDGLCRFRFRFEEAGLDPAAALAQMNPKEGDWMVLGDPATTRPWDILKGRVVVIRKIDDRGLVAELLGISSSTRPFCYRHYSSRRVERGKRYVLDPMADDMVSSRLLDACQHAEGNALLGWIEAGGGAVRRRRARPGERAAVEEFARALEQAPSILTPTQRQAEVIAGRLAEPVLLVQGPPGTGKTHTIAWAILARAYAAARAEREFRVLVCSMTHTAVEVLLRSLVAKLEQLKRDRSTQELARTLRGLAVFKEVADANNAVPEGVRAIRGSDARRALGERLAVIGAVPGGVHRLLEGPGKSIRWDDERFDLVVIDEASQVSLPAAVLAGAALRRDGQALIVGDHRQMPPILVHDWEHEPRRTAQDTQVYRSTFESLLARDFPVVRLDRSFRLHAMHARFLEEHVYREDQVGFHSELDHTLPPVAGLRRKYVAAALAPEYPVVVIEHTEAASLKQNDVEIEIVAPIIRAAINRLGLDGRDGIGVVVPHRAQRAALQRRFPELAAAGAIDTVERFQGGERDLIVVSATASDPEFVLAEASFLLNPNRLNVAFSRPRKKLIVVGSTTIFRLMPPDMQTFENALLWKRLRYEFSADVLWEGSIAGAEVRISGRRAEPHPSPVPPAGSNERTSGDQNGRGQRGRSVRSLSRSTQSTE